MNTLPDLRDVLAEEPTGLRAPDLDAVMAGGRSLRRRRTTARGLGALAAVALVVAGATGVVGSVASDTDDVAATPDAVVEHAAAARAAHDEADARVRRFARLPLDAAAWSGTRPDGEQGSRALPRDDREWATLQWLRWTAELPGGGRLYVSSDNEPAGDAAAGPPPGQEQEACTRVFVDDRCTTTRVPGGVVAVERGHTDTGERGLRASYTPDDPAGSWVMADVTTPQSAQSPYTAAQLVDLVTDGHMALPVPLARDELPEE